VGRHLVITYGLSKKNQYVLKNVENRDVILLFFFPMKKLSLSDFEYHISQTAWSMAQDMVAGGRVRSLKEVERHFWVASVEDEEATYESEVIISPSKINAFACECWSEPRKYMCVHIAATLLQVRRFLDQRAAEKAQVAREKAAAQSEITRLSIRHILPAVSFDDLQDFVKEYARRDTDFAQALKTRFAEVVDDNKKAYHLLLQSVLPKPGKNIREQDFRRLKRTLQDLGARSQKAEQIGNQVVVAKIAIAVLEVMAPVIKIVPASRKEVLLDICHQSFLQLVQYYQSPSVPQELRDIIWDCWLKGIVSGVFPTDLQRDIIRQMSDVAVADSGRFNTISTHYFEGVRPLSVVFIHLYLICLAKKGMNTAVVKILKDVLLSTVEKAADEIQSISFLRAALLELYYTNCFSATLLVINYLRDHFTLNPSRKTELERIRFNIAEATKDIPAQLMYLKQTYLTFGQQETIEKMKALTGDYWPHLLQDLIAAANTQGNREKIALLLANESDTTVFCAWLDQQDDSVLTLRYHQALSDEFLLGHLSRIFSAHLDGHFGLPAAGFVRDRLMVLAQQGRADLVREIMKQVILQHPERSGLKEALEEVWAKLRARQVGLGME
jgi:cell division protein FtsB